jgi:hypothetical protein
MFNKRQNLDKIIRQQVEDFFGQSLVLESIIHRYVGVAEATAMKKGVVENSVASSATFDFMKLFNELKREMNYEQENKEQLKASIARDLSQGQASILHQELQAVCSLEGVCGAGF